MKSPPIFNFESKSKIQKQKHIGSQSRKVQKYTNSNLARKRDPSENPAKSEIKNLASCSPAINVSNKVPLGQLRVIKFSIFLYTYI